MTQKKPRILTVDGVENLRDLGGYPTSNNEIIKTNKYFRSAALHTMTPKGKEAFDALGIRTVIDLRSQVEVDRYPTNSNILNGVKYVHLPMLDHLNSAIAADQWTFPESMLAMYQQLLERYTAEFREMFSVFSDAEDGILFHCTMGKDRTGVTAMLLYGLTTMDRDLIAQDYGYSEKILGIETNLPPKMPAYAARTKPVYMQDTIHWVEENYGSIREYLTGIGVSTREMQTIQKHLGVSPN